MGDVQTICPYCGADALIDLTERVLCGNCRKEWAADSPPSVLDAGRELVGDIDTALAGIDLDATVRPEAMPNTETLDDVLGAPDDVAAADAGQAALDELIGTQVVLEGGQVATIVDFPDDDHIRVEFRSGDDVIEWRNVDMGDVVRSVLPAPEQVDVDEPTAEALARANATVAILALRAGLATLDFGTDPVGIIQPPDGWLPDDPGMLPTIEQGVAYAVAVLVAGLHLPADLVESIVEGLASYAQQGTETEEPDNAE